MLRERDGYSFEDVDMGAIFHGVLEIFGEKLKEHGWTWFDFPREEGKSWWRRLWRLCGNLWGSRSFDNAESICDNKNQTDFETNGVNLQYQLKKAPSDRNSLRFRSPCWRIWSL